MEHKGPHPPQALVVRGLVSPPFPLPRHRWLVNVLSPFESIDDQWLFPPYQSLKSIDGQWRSPASWKVLEVRASFSHSPKNPWWSIVSSPPPYENIEGQSYHSFSEKHWWSLVLPPLLKKHWLSVVFLLFAPRKELVVSGFPPPLKSIGGQGFFSTLKGLVDSRRHRAH